jgi:hypothetical protein
MSNRKYGIALATVLGAATLVVLTWLIAPVQTTLASVPAAEAGAFATAAVSPTSQIHSPYRDALITQKGSQTVSGFAWDTGANPPFLAGDTYLTAEQTTEWAYLLHWTVVPSASFYLVEEATDPQFSNSQTIYFGAELVCPVAKSEAGTYYYRVKADASGVEPTRYSNVVSVILPWTTASTLASTSTDLAANGTLTIQVSIDGVANGAWQTVTAVTPTVWGGWEWSYAWSLPEENDVQHVIRTRASNAAGNTGPTDAITVRLDTQFYLVYLPLVSKRWPPTPYAPTLNDISNGDGDGNYTVSWSYGDHPDVPVNTYTLQEATNAGFTANLIIYSLGSNTTQVISGKGPGTYYYRVQGNNTWGPGDWSATKSVTVVPQGYHDDFNSSSTGWAIRRGDDNIDESGDFRVVYRNDQLYTLLKGRFDFAVASPMVVARPIPYTIKARVKVVDETVDGDDYWPKSGETYGIIFGGNGGSPCPADRDTARGTGCLSHYYRLLVVWTADKPTTFQWSLKRIDYHDPDNGGKGDGHTLIDYQTASTSSINDWNTWEIRVSDTTPNIKVYLNGAKLGQANDTHYINDPYFGVFMASPDVGGVGYKWEWFEVQ